MKYRVACQIILTVEAESEDDVEEAVQEELWDVELIAINSILEPYP
jgi:hypothetical protein